MAAMLDLPAKLPAIRLLQTRTRVDAEGQTRRGPRAVGVLQLRRARAQQSRILTHA